MARRHLGPKLVQFVERLPAVNERVDTFHVGTGNRIVADDHEHLEVAADTPELGVTEALEDPSVAEGAACHVTDHDGIRRCLMLETRRDVSDIAKDRRVHPATPPQFSHDRQARVSADP